MSILDYAILAVVIIWFIAALAVIVSGIKKGKHGCCGGGGCSKCCDKCSVKHGCKECNK